MSCDITYTCTGDETAIPKFFLWLNQGLRVLYPGMKFEAAGVLNQHLLVVLVDRDRVLALFDIGENSLEFSDIAIRVGAGLESSVSVSNQITRNKWQEWMQ